MNAPKTDSHLKEAAVLTRAVENVMRKFVRLLIGRMSFTRFQELTRLVFVEEAEEYLKREKPGKNVPMTKLALLTGLDTRTLGKVRDLMESNNTIANNESFLKSFMPTFRVLDVWLNDKKFVDSGTGEPRVLSLADEKPNFEQLVSQALTSRGITPTSILERLVQNGIAEVDRQSNSVRLIREDMTFLSHDQLDMMEVGLTSISHLVATVAHNIEYSGEPSKRFYQRGLWSYKLSLQERELFRTAMTDYLLSLSDDAKNAIEPFEKDQDDGDHFTGGISMFYFEGDVDNR